MKLYYAYPYILPLCGTVIDDYEDLSQHYLEKGLYSEYWNNLLRILLRKYRMPINRFFRQTVKYLVVENDIKFSRYVSTWFHDSLVFKELQQNKKFDRETVSFILKQHLSSLIKELKDLNTKRKELCITYSINIIPYIAVNKYYPTIGKEKWECGTLVNNDSLYFCVKRHKYKY